MFVAGGAAEVTVVVSVRVSGGQSPDLEGDVVRGEVRLEVRLDLHHRAPPPPPVSAGHVRGSPEHELSVSECVSGVTGQLQLLCPRPPTLSLGLLTLLVQITFLLGQPLLLAAVKLVFQIFSAALLLLFLVR